MRNNIVPEVRAEWDRATHVIVSSPGHEILYGALFPEIENFQDSLSLTSTVEEHRRFRETLEQEGIRVINLEDVLLSDYASLMELAKSSGDYDENRLRKLSKEDLLRVIREKPRTVKIQQERFYMVDPVSNQYFQRDPQITTAEGMVIGRMYNPPRRFETTICQANLRILGIDPKLFIEHPGVLEGGDYIPAGDFCMIGYGFRTNENAIEQLLSNDVLGFDEVAAVKDPYKGEDEMHLDTYFMMVAKDKALVLDERLSGMKEPEVNIHVKENGKYVEGEKGMPFSEFLRSKGIGTLPISKDMQDSYGMNVLPIGSNRIIAVDSLPESYYKMLEDNGVEVIKVHLKNITKGYGGPHCMTQVIRREK